MVRRMARIWSIGHSTHCLADFVAIVRQHQIVQLADVRAYPGSRRHPHFGRESLERALPEHGIAYRWMPGLGGRRRRDPESTANAAWRLDAFRAYADHMRSAAFETALAELQAWAEERPTVYMCAEALHFRCHRWLISDALAARGWSVLHVRDAKEPLPHTITAFAQIDSRGRVTYPGQDTLPWNSPDPA
jgi:uncharacterized protein (DUF488 family)